MTRFRGPPRGLWGVGIRLTSAVRGPACCPINVPGNARLHLRAIRSALRCTMQVLDFKDRSVRGSRCTPNNIHHFIESGALLTPTCTPQRPQGGIGKGHTASQIACGRVVGPPKSSSELPLTLHGSNWDKNGARARCPVNDMLPWPSPGPLWGRHNADRRASDPYVYAPDTPGRATRA